jgi:hypothetical protein
MFVRLLLFFVLLGAALRFLWRLLLALFGQPTIRQSQAQKKRAINLDESQIQDADFKDL